MNDPRLTFASHGRAGRPTRRDALSLLLSTLALPAFAQDAAAGPVTLISTTGAGGASDTVGRALAAELAKGGRPYVVENRTGAGGSIAASYVAKTAPDGRTLLIGSNATHGVNSAMFKKLSYDPVQDFTPVALLGSFVFGVVVASSLPVNDIRGLIAYAKANPGKLDYAGASSTGVLMTEALLSGTGTKMQRVPYSGAVKAMPDLASGRVAVAVMDLATAASFVRDGKLKLLAVTSHERNPHFPQVPTLRETILPNFDIASWIGIFAPARTPAAIVEPLNTRINAVLANPAIRQRLSDQLMFEVQPKTLRELDGFVPREVAKFVRLAKDAGIEAE